MIRPSPTAIAVPIEDYVWCQYCEQPHPADFDTETLLLYMGEECSGVEEIEVDELPKDWEKDYEAHYGDGSSYILYPLRPPIGPNQYPMYYLEENAVSSASI